MKLLKIFLLITFCGLLSMSVQAATHIDTAGNKYVGQMVNGTYHGHGTLHFKSSGGKYVGQFSNGTYHGQGTFYFKKSSSRIKYVGQWVNSKFGGYGTLYYKNGSKTAGQWVNGVVQ